MSRWPLALGEVALLKRSDRSWPLAPGEGALKEASECSEVSLYGQISMVEYKHTNTGNIGQTMSAEDTVHHRCRITVL
jgi:hypothetical protein